MVEAGPDVADDWIAERSGPRDIVVTSDIPLAGRCLQAGAAVLRPNGRSFDEASIGMALAHREVAEHLRSFGQATSGPPPFGPADRSPLPASAGPGGGAGAQARGAQIGGAGLAAAGSEG